MPSTLPDALTEDLRFNPGMQNFLACPLAHVVRAGGSDIRPKVEDEQACVTFRILHLALQHPDDWRERFKAELDAAVARAGRKERP